MKGAPPTHVATACATPHSGCVDLMVDRHVRAGRGAHCALIERTGNGPTQRRWLSYLGLQLQTQHVATLLAQRGAALGMQGSLRIAIIGSATLETVTWFLGAMRCGHLVFLVHPNLPPHHYELLFGTYRPDLVLRDRTAHCTLGECMPCVEADSGEEVSVPEGQQPPGATGIGMDAFVQHDMRPALVLASSGSTGRPKLCVHAHRNFWHFERDVSRPMWRLNANDRVLASGGPFFSFGLQGIHAPLAVGATAILLPEWSVHADFLHTIEAERATVFLAVPTLYHLLQSRTDAELLARQTRSLRVAMSAGERLPKVVRQRWETPTRVPLCDSIGTTESFAPYLSEVVGAGPGLKDVGGFHYEMRFTDTVGATGEPVYMAAIKGSCMMLGYLSEQGQLLAHNAYFPTQDLFTLQEQGWGFVSRRSERVKVSGQWVSPQELEEFLLQDPRVLKAAALPLETAEGLLRLRAYVVARQGIDQSALCAQLLETARMQLRPKALCPDAVHCIEELCATPTGKFRRSEFHQTVRARTQVPVASPQEALV